MSSKENYLIISIDEQDWMKAKRQIKEIGPKRCHVMIVGIDSTFLDGYEGLCEDAIFAQKIYNVYKFGKELGIPRIINLGHNEFVNIDKLISELQIQILIGGIRNILVSKNKILIDILNKIKETFDSITIKYI